MSRKRYLFSGGSRSISAKVSNSKNRTHHTEIDNSKEALEERSIARKILPTVKLKGIFPADDRGKAVTYHYDFTDLVAKFPHHRRLINQLIAGISYARRGTSRKNLDMIFKSIPE